mgnify:CR=1 FL=1
MSDPALSHAAPRPYFWLHIKKSAGQSVRTALGATYRETDRSHPTPFIALPREEWNDNLNNFRIPLGDYDFRRMLFARRFLFDSEADFQGTFKFAVVRNPYDRALSCWRYLYSRHTRLWRRALTYFSFEYFLRSLPEIWAERRNRHIATHTAPMWPDMTDTDGTLLLDDIAYLERLPEDFSRIARRIELPAYELPHKNRGKTARSSPDRAYSRRTRRLVEELYQEDLENLYPSLP